MDDRIFQQIGAPQLTSTTSTEVLHIESSGHLMSIRDQRERQHGEYVLQ